MTPLAARLRDVIVSEGALTVERLRRKLRRNGLNVPEDLIDRELRANPGLFRPTGTGAWDLAENVGSPGPGEASDSPEPTDPLVAGALSPEFVVVDLETTGIDPSVDEIVQIAAVGFSGGRPIAAFNRYVRTTRVSLSESLRVRMGWEEVPDEELVDRSTALSEFDRFRQAAVVVAWNADFERRMFASVEVSFERLVDALAVAMIVYPHGPHRLGDIAQRVGVWPDSLPADLAVAGHAPNQFAAHDAVFDCLAAGLVHSACLEQLRNGVGPDVPALLPELGELGSERVARQFASRGARSMSTDTAGVLHEILERQVREHRPAQLRAAQLASTGLSGSPTIVEAPTGTGKTLAYLAAALASAAQGERLALVTAFKNLQDQLVDELNDAIDALDAPIRFAVLKGGDNYLCRRRLAHVIERLGTEDSDLRFLSAVLTRLLEDDPLATREDASWWLLNRLPRAAALLDEVAVACQHAECGRAAAIDAANAADLVVLNQVLWLEPPERFTTPSRVVIDEAHDLEEMATLAFTESIGSSDLFGLVNRLDPAGRRGLLDAIARFGIKGDRARFLAQRVRTVAREARLPLARFANALTREVTPDDGGRVRLRRAPKILHPGAWTNAEDSLRDLRDALTSLADELADIASTGAVIDPLAVDDLWDIAARAREYEQLLWQIPAVRETAKVHYLDVGGDGSSQWELARAPISVAEQLSPVWDSLAGFVLMSATLQTGPDDFTYVTDRLGLRGRVSGGAHAIDSDFPLEKNVVFGLARWFESIPTPRFMEEFQAETAQEVETLARFGDGRQLALFTARSRLESVGTAITEPLARHGIPVLQQGKGPRAALLDEFRAREESVLLGTRSFWQGVDVPGPSLSFLVIEKLPYPHVKDPVVEARLELARRMSGSDFDDYLLPQMIITLKQGFGRLVRSRVDRGAVLLLDRRLHVKPYQHRVFGALPGFAPRNFEAERSRRAFYEHIDTMLPGLVSERGRAFLESLAFPPSIDTDLIDIAVGGDRESRRPAVLEAMLRIFGSGFTDFRSPEQEELFWKILDGDDVIGLLPTGAGKSLPFQLAALVTPGVTLVISPLIALMRDQVENLFDKGVRAVGALVGAMSADERDETLRLAASGRIRLLYVAPERLRDPVFLDRLSQLDLQRVVVDEAHCVSLWGPSFRPDFLAIRSALAHAGHASVPTAALTATATPEIEADIRRSLEIADAYKVAMSFSRPELQLAVMSPTRGLAGDRITNRKQRTRQLIRVLTAAERRGETAIVYVPTVREADQVANQLRQVGLGARAYHGRMDPWSRQNVEEMFREGEIDFVVATKAFGMGIDRADVRYVIHLGYPADLESYYQEAGRAGRDGADAHCLLLTLPRDRSTQDWFIDRVAELDASIAAAARWFMELGAGTHLVDLEALEDELGLDDDTQARIIVHYLEAAEGVTRLPDQTVRARVLPLGEISDAQLRDALERSGARAFLGVEIDLEDIARDLGTTAGAVETALLSASRREELVFRPIERHATIIVNDMSRLGSPDTTAVVRAMRRKLDLMVAYTNSSTCRQVLLREYLGEKDAEPCGRCDNCVGPEFPRPWMGVTVDSLPDADRLLDPELTVLAAIDWNAAEVAAGRNPYGRGALSNVLAGDRFNLGRYSVGAERARRIRRAEASPYWGALALTTNPADRINAAIDRLTDRGAITTLLHTPGAGGRSDVTPYEYLVLRENGRERLEQGLVDR